MGRFFQSKTKQSGYGQAADKRATSGKFSDFPTKIAKKIDTLQTKIDTIIDTHKAVGKSLPINKKNIIRTLKNKIQGLKIANKKEFQKKAKEQNLQTTKNNPRLKALKDKMNKEAYENKKSGRRVGDKERKNLKRLKVDQRPKKRKQPIDPRDIFIEGPRTTGGKKGGRGMGKALRGGGKVMRG